MSKFKKDDWVKLVDADCNDRKAGLINGDVGQVSGFYGGYPIIDFGGANPGRIMLSQRLALISPAEAASVGDTVTVAADSPWAPGGVCLVVGLDERQGRRDWRLLVTYDYMNLWVDSRFITALKRGADAKITEPRQFRVGDWVKLVDAYCIDRDAGLINGDVGQVSRFYGGYPIIDFGGANHLMWSQQCVLISPAEAASADDTVTIGADSPKRKAVVKTAEPRQFKVGDWVTKNTSLYGEPLTAGKIVSLNMGLGRATVKFPGWTGGRIDDTGGFSGSCWGCSLDDLTLAEAPAATIEANSTLAEAPKPEVAAPVDPEKPQTFIVVSDEGAALWPFKHKYDRRGSAEAEAGHRAMIKPGMKFTVYQAVTVVEAPKPGVSVVFLDKAV
jgi:hypothetical protein